MAKTGRERILGFKKILTETQGLPEEQVGKKEMILLLKKNIRIEEMAIFRRFYFDQGCYFGLLLIQSQVFENQIRNLVTSCETYLEKSKNDYIFFNYKSKVDEMTLGGLINGPLSYYLVYDGLQILLKDFNQFRKKVIHHLTDDYDVELIDLEREIAVRYIANDYSKIENMILEASTRINIRVAEITAFNNQIVDHIGKAMRSILDMPQETIYFKFDRLKKI